MELEEKLHFFSLKMAATINIRDSVYCDIMFVYRYLNCPVVFVHSTWRICCGVAVVNFLLLFVVLELKSWMEGER